MFELYQVGIAFILALVGVFAWAASSWRSKSKSQDLEVAVPEYIDFSNAGTRGFYVATTFAGEPLHRVSAHGLGFAGKSNLVVSVHGIEVYRVGERSFRIVSSSLMTVTRSTAVIDKIVEKDGLLSFRWVLGTRELETHFRFADSEARDQIALEASKLIVGAK